MKAIVRETYGPPDVLHVEDVPLPPVGDDDVLVKVRAASENAGDWHLLRGTPLPLRLVAGLRKPELSSRSSATTLPAASQRSAATSPSSVPGITCSENRPGAASVSEVPAAIRYVE